jgi:hypothetical protein
MSAKPGDAHAHTPDRCGYVSAEVSETFLTPRLPPKRLITMTRLGQVSRRVVATPEILLVGVVLLSLVPLRFVAAEPKQTDHIPLPTNHASHQLAYSQSPTERQKQAVASTDKRQAASLVQIELKDKNGSDFVMRATELERGAKTSKIKMVTKKRIGSVGASMFVVRAFYDIAQARKCEYFVNLKEWDDEDNNHIFLAGFTNKKDAGIKKEFGNEYDYLNESGQKRALLSVSQFALIFETAKTIPPPTQH